VETVDRPVGVFVVPAVSGTGWQLVPVLSLDAIRLVAALGGTLGRDLTAATLPAEAADEVLERINRNTLHAGPKECLDSAGQLSEELARALGRPVSASAPRDKRDRWGRLSALSGRVALQLSGAPAVRSVARRSSARRRPLSRGARKSAGIAHELPSDELQTRAPEAKFLQMHTKCRVR
jgi:hypothetical protein